MSESMETLRTDREIPDVPAEETAPQAPVTTAKPVDIEERKKEISLLEELARNPHAGGIAGSEVKIPKDEPVAPPVIPQQTPKAGMPLKAVQVEEPDRPAGTPTAIGRMMTVEEATAAGIDTTAGKVVNPEDSYAENMKRQDEMRKEAEKADIDAMAEQLFADEEARMQRLENTLALPDDDPRKKELLGDRKTRVETATVSSKDREKDDKQLGISGYDEDDLLPSYTMDDEDEKTPEAEEETPPDPGEESYADYVKGLEVAEIVPSDKPVIEIIREPQVETVIVSDKKKPQQNLGDQAFMNAITRFKQERFGKVTVPMVNSGFMADIVGTGVVDIQQLYINVSEDTKIYEYQMEQMRIIIRNITGANPKIDPVDLRNKIHYKDFQMMAFGHLCATLKSVESVANCTKCDSPFRVTVRPSELLVNMDELKERAMQIASAPNVESVSLMNKYKIITTSNGIVVTLGHPSYANELTILNSFLAYYNNMTPADKHRFESMLQTLYFVRKIQLPTGVITANIYQNYQAFGLMDTSDKKLIDHEVNEMRKEILEPKFGIREVRCPHCGEIVKNITYRNILDLLFLHFQLESYLHPDQTEK